MSLLWVAVIAFGLAALGGLTMLTLRLGDRPLPMPLALLHGAGAATGLACLAVAVLGGGAPPLATYALIGFAAGALGGFYLFSIHLRGKVHPVALIVVHGGIAATSFALLLIAVLRG